MITGRFRSKCFFSSSLIDSRRLPRRRDLGGSHLATHQVLRIILRDTYSSSIQEHAIITIHHTHTCIDMMVASAARTLDKNKHEVVKNRTHDTALLFVGYIALLPGDYYTSYMVGTSFSGNSNTHFFGFVRCSLLADFVLYIPVQKQGSPSLLLVTPGM